jgi:murein DD-endopeptidase MepM/ murein hydrolase activator NlpD
MKIFRKTRDKYRLIIYNDSTFEEVRSMKLTKLNVFSLFAFLVIILVSASFFVLFYSPVKNYIPGVVKEYHQIDTVKILDPETLIKLDSVERYCTILTQQNNAFKQIVYDEPDTVPPIKPEQKQDTILELSPSKNDSLFRERFENEKANSISFMKNAGDGLIKMNFYPPVLGMISRNYNAAEGHLGTDIAAPEGELICATYDGTVILSEWSSETGCIVQIQHEGNFVSIYKHMEKSLVDQADYVKAGDPIAVIGNSGEYSTGVHLHFELWYNGSPLNPENYITAW